MNLITFYKLILISLIVIFVGLVFYGFPDSPSPWFDEGLNLGIAKSWVEQGVYSLQTAPNAFVEERSLLITTNYPLLFFIALSFTIFGVGLWQAKIVMILFLFVFSALFYQLTKKYYGKWFALASFALLITFLPLYGNGKSVLGEIPGLVYFLGGLLMLDTKRSWQVFVMGLFFGLAAVTKPIYLLILAAVFSGEIWAAIKDKNIPYRRWLWMTGGAILPLFVWLYTLIPGHITRDYIANILSYYGNPYKTENTMIPNLFKFISESTPIHFALLLGVFIFSKIITKLRSFTRSEVVLLVFIFLNFFFFLKTAGWYRYFFPAHILLFILFPAALFRVAQKLTGKKSFKVYAPIIIVMTLFIAQSANLFAHIRDTLYFNPQPRQFSNIINEVVPADKNILVVNHPEIAFFLNSDRVWQYVKTSPHLVNGADLFAQALYPQYVVSGSWLDDFYLRDYLGARENYDLILEGGKYYLYALR